MKYSLKKVDEDAVAGFGDYSYSYDDPPVSKSVKTSDHFLIIMLEPSASSKTIRKTIVFRFFSPYSKTKQTFQKSQNCPSQGRIQK